MVPKVDSVGLIYPVITLEAPYTHTTTHRILVGNNASPAEEASWSVQNYVTRSYLPTFLAQAEDDPVSNPFNTELMRDTCRRNRVPVELIEISRGGYGFGLGKAGSPAVLWDQAYVRWLDRLS
nr:alpha/beta hydrolase [Candidatus Pantoea persica]